MAELTFPQRQRCKTCRSKFTTDVLAGLYCSYTCAGKPTPPSDPDKADRQCAYTPKGSDRAKFKIRYRAESEIPGELRARDDRQVYLCPVCMYWHTGTRQIRDMTGKASMVLTSPKELGDMLRKARGTTDKKVIAKQIRTRPIRITEIENGADAVDPTVLFALLRLYRIAFSAVFQR